jgi:integrase
MAKVTFFLKSSRYNEPAPVILRLRDSRSVDIEVRTRLQVVPLNWSKSNQEMMAKPGIIPEDRFRFNEALIDMRATILKEYSSLLLSGKTPTRKWLLGCLGKKVRKPSLPKDTRLLGFIQTFIDEVSSGLRLTDSGQRYQPSTIKAFVGFQSMLREYMKETGEKLDYNDIDLKFYGRYLQFFIARDYSANTIGRHVKHLKTIMRAAREEGYHQNVEIERKKFKVIRVPTSEIYLTRDELHRMMAVDLSEKPLLAKARDLFLIGCFTAQRFSDYSRIRPEHIKILRDGTRVIELHQLKTTAKVVIPILPELEIILERNHYTSPSMLVQKMNFYLKQIGLLAGIDQIYEKEVIKGGRRSIERIKRCDMIKSHTARRTGCTLMYLSGIPSIAIMKISGHKSENEFLKYIRVSQEETAAQVAAVNWFPPIT